ncbi:ATP-dependent Clp protease ATP-binding subunit [Tersicoccus sp. Bi-70]|uniref:ATP-dependent Clp protease ATP-binding subunit n=1 Tax=Tersicoccus sp. Bi-70 TaxID=1897634 RepID=UPI0009753D56|nr:ATP-dependent Clp protease ATP-binding subunit [Tersicoccus sp. Bi-70]OMH34123.1 AAA family ATPase [Tersicoccus sp. Bi-70]
MPMFFGPAAAGSGSFEDFLAQYLQGQRTSRAGRPVDLTRLLSRRTHDVIASAVRFAAEHGHHDVDALHVLRVMVQRDEISEGLRHLGTDPADVVRAIDARLPEKTDGPVDATPSLTHSAQRVLLDAYQVARSFGSTYIDPEHVFFALVLNQDAPAGQILTGAGITPQSLQQAGAEEAARQQGAQQSGLAGAAGQTGESMLATYGTDLTERARNRELDPVIGRADEIEQAIEILARRTKNNPVLIGEAGVGKTAVVEGLAQAIAADEVPAQLAGKRVISLDLPGMIAGTRYRGDFEERLTKTLDEIAAEQDGVIVFIDELHTVVGAGGGGGSEGGMDAGNILKPKLARGELHLIGATTLGEYRKIEKDPALERRFQPVTVGEPNVEDAVLILAGLKDRYEEHHGVTYTDAALRAAVEMSHRYVTDRYLPDKAIDLIDQAGARLSLRRGPAVDVDALRAEVARLESEKEDAVADERYEEASTLRDAVEVARGKVADAELSAKHAAGGFDTDRTVDEDLIAQIISRATGIPAARLTEDDKSRLSHLEADLHERVIGQEDAVTAIARAVRRNRTGMGDDGRPVGSFLFLGPTGVGKTELTKALAASLFGDESAMIRLDMSEFGERHTVSRLVGAPPGYVGYDEAGQLTEKVRRNPYSVILLDEVEKAHPDVFNLLLQVLDDGRLTDGQGRTVDFRNTVVVMTSNVGSEFLASKGGALGFHTGNADGFGSEEELRARVMGRLRETMRPEFINRIDDIVLFRKLETDQLRSIVGLQLGRTRTRLAAQGITLTVELDAIDWLADTGYEPEYGARPLRRVIQRHVDDAVADLLVAGALHEGGTAVVGVADGELTVSAARVEAPLAA